MTKIEGKTVLIVEKQPNQTQLLVKQAMLAGLNPIVAVTGEGGLSKVTEHRPHLILLELDLSDMNGLDFVSTLRQRPEADRIPIIGMSVFPHMRAPSLSGGCNDFLLKPVKMIELMGLLRKFLHQL
jgi:two-component system, chemotaxis family, chemotaxis protein CheY